MKKSICAAAILACVAGSAMAGGVAEPIMEPEVVTAETTSSSSAGIIIPLLLLLAVVAATSGGSGGYLPPT